MSVKFYVHEITFYMVHSCLLSPDCGPSEAPDNNGSGCSDGWVVLRERASLALDCQGDEG